jgi:hypothetical protein
VKGPTGIIWTLVVVFAAMTSGCGYPSWYVHVRSVGMEDVIVRVIYNGGHQDAFVPTGTDMDVIKIPGDPATATVLFLDPQTCAVIGTGDLPTESEAASGPVYRGFPQRLEIFAAKRDPAAPVAPSDDRCAAAVQTESPPLDG